VVLEPAAVDGTMRGSQGVAVDLLEMLYSVFTLKELPAPPPLMDEAGGLLRASTRPTLNLLLLLLLLLLCASV